MSQTIGRQEPAPLSKLPRFHTTEADDAAFLAEGYGLKPDPWQKLFLDHAMGRDAKGRMTCTQACLSVPRQNGKNAIIEMIELYQMIVLGRKILHTAHEVKTARAPLVIERGGVRKSNRGHNRTYKLTPETQTVN